MAAEMVAEASASGSEVDKVVYSYFTAGTGGVGPTILATTFLLLGEEVVLYEEGKRVLKKPFTQRRVLNFGERVGIREVRKMEEEDLKEEKEEGEISTPNFLVHQGVPGQPPRGDNNAHRPRRPERGSSLWHGPGHLEWRDGVNGKVPPTFAPHLSRCC